jgi:hypothetical protein
MYMVFPEVPSKKRLREKWRLQAHLNSHGKGKGKWGEHLGHIYLHDGDGG